MEHSAQQLQPRIPEAESIQALQGNPQYGDVDL